MFILHDNGLNQLLKCPMLFVHYHEHQQRNASIGVMEFLCIHYWGHDIDDNDDDRDIKLPYKSVDVHAFQHSYVPLARTITVKQQTNSPVIIHYPVLKDQYLPEPALSSLFRPPKVG
ncbi:hypothetical protein KTO58_03600 [Chitinophaga pendula]|uniref:hypothetical protein n=1 Tax=Chitinophaga TaxID=79328 RepID=UPI0012FE717E|nr:MULTISPECIES: hypothetical protein [Chitinophaga]UCJ08282.1 hypothetical protein KTO58_03600 [Chitinophaga pendula]